MYATNKQSMFERRQSIILQNSNNPYFKSRGSSSSKVRIKVKHKTEPTSNNISIQNLKDDIDNDESSHRWVIKRI